MMCLLAQDKVRYGVGWPFLVPAETLEPWMQQSSNRGTLGKGSPPGQSGNLGRDPLLANEIAALVPMDTLISELGFSLNMRTRRTRCLVHGGDNPTAFGWTVDGLWHCFACGRGGDRIKLVMEVRRCSFKNALSYLAILAGVKLCRFDSFPFRRKLELRCREKERLRRAAEYLHAAQLSVLLHCRNELQSLERLRQRAGQRLAELNRGAPEKFLGETDIAWEALRFVSESEIQVCAAYYIAAFASQEDRARFCLRPTERAEMIRYVLECGFVVDGRGHAMEIVL